MRFQVHAARSGVTETVDPGESIIVALRRGGVDILNSCGQGVCGTCETGVVEGTPDHRDTLLDDRERAEGRCMFPCVSDTSRDAGHPSISYSLHILPTIERGAREQSLDALAALAATRSQAEPS